MIHVLNGDALREQFPRDIAGQQLVARECLVQGPVAAESIPALFRLRADYLQPEGEQNGPDYQRDVVPQFEAIAHLPDDAQICLWFEDDLFCQVNMWFVCFLLKPERQGVYWVRPTAGLQFGFGGMSSDELRSAWVNRVALTTQDVAGFSRLWQDYQSDAHDVLLEHASRFESRFPEIKVAVNAHIDRFPSGGEPGRPERILMDIVSDLGTHEFAPVFREFCRRDPVYGFGDLQVKTIMEQLYKA